MSEREGIPVHIPNAGQIDGAGPIVLVGANGSGKTHIASNIRAPGRKVEWVGASRTLAPPARVGRAHLDEAEQQLSNMTNTARQQSWATYHAFQPLIARLLQAHEHALMAVVQRVEPGEKIDAVRPKTKLERTMELWGELLPGRRLEIQAVDPLQAAWADDPPYKLESMSDGERAILYAIMSVIVAAEGAVVTVDEPELHVHALLARTLWDELEAERPDCRFVYATHDLSFAISRSRATYVLCRSRTDCELLPGEHLPRSLAVELIGAASFVRQGDKLVFCEGEPGGLDDQLYSAVFDAEGTAIVPVGRCEDVCDCVRALKGAGFIAGATVTGIIDRDHRPDAEIAALEGRGVRVLRYHELESVLADPEVVSAMAKAIPGVPNEPDYDAEFQKTKNALQNQVHIVALERAQDRILSDLRGVLGQADKTTATTARNGFTTGVSGACGAPAGVYDEELDRLKAALETPATALELFPGKDFKRITQKLWKKDNWSSCTSAVLDVLRGKHGKDAQNSMRAALEKHLPTLLSGGS